MSKHGDAETDANVANVVVGVGVVAVGVSTVWLLLGNGSGAPEKQAAGRLAVGASVGPGAASASVETRFQFTTVQVSGHSGVRAAGSPRIWRRSRAARRVQLAAAMRSSPVLLFSVLGWALPSVALAQSPAPYFQPGAAPPPASAFAAPPGAASAPAQAILAGTVPVHFVGPSGERLHVSVSGAVEAACDLPCTLHLPPGEASVEISGDDHFRTSVRVPEDGGVVEVSTGSTGLMVTGIVLLAAGAGTSTVLFSTGTSKDASEMTKEEARGRFIIALGCAALAVTGLVLWLSAGRDGAEMKPGRSHVAKAPGGGLRFRGVDVAVGSKHDAMLGAAWSF